MTLRTVMLSLQALLAAAEPDDPQDAVVARQYKSNHSLFIKTAECWTHMHAGGKILFLYLNYHHRQYFIFVLQNLQKKLIGPYVWQGRNPMCSYHYNTFYTFNGTQFSLSIYNILIFFASCRRFMR